MHHKNIAHCTSELLSNFSLSCIAGTKFHASNFLSLFSKITDFSILQRFTLIFLCKAQLSVAADPVEVGCDSRKCNRLSHFTFAAAITDHSNQRVTSSLNNGYAATTVTITRGTLSARETDISCWVEIVVKCVVNIDAVSIFDDW